MYLVDMAKSNNPTNLRIAMLRDSFDKAGVEGYLVPVRDEYGNEFVPDCFRRLEYLTGFSGSNGLALILREHALFFTDGRYLTQSAREINLDIFEIKDQSEIKNINWTKYLSNNPAIGYNPALFTLRNIEIFKFLNLKTISQDLIDLIWSDRPEPIRFQAYEYPVEFAGQSVQKKISNLLDSMRLSECEGLLITSCESICWLLNLRGGEVAFSPIICGTLFITCQNIRLLVPYPENFKEVQTFIPNLDVLSHDRLGEILSDFDGRIGFDPNYTNLEIYDFLKLKNTKHIGDPCLLSRAIKNEIEIKHSRAVHLEDAIAMCEFLSYIDSEFQAGGLPYLTEYDLTLRLTDLRSKRRGYFNGFFPYYMRV
jgi:Xaa-Pro aminopeptidase